MQPTGQLSNLPQEINFASGNKIRYFYTADGLKQKKEVYEDSLKTSEMSYKGSFIYEETGLAYVLFDEGRLLKDGTSYTYEYFLKDHLGNTRVSFTKDGTIIQKLQEDHYYPFGMAFQGVNSSILSPENKYKYNGKVGAQRKSRSFGKLNDELDLDWYDYGARFYDAAIGRFHTIDPWAEKYSFQSVFVYAINSPIRFTDFLGMGPGDEIKKNEVSTPTNPILYSGSKVNRTNTSIVVTKTVFVSISKANTSKSTINGSNSNINNVSDKSAKVISNSMQESGESTVEISSTYRSPDKQADVMYDNLESKGTEHQCNLYGPSGDKVIDAYVEASAVEGATESSIKSSMTSVINSVGPGNVSKHSSDTNVLNVIDIAPSSVSNVESFQTSLSKNSGVSKIIPYPKDPGIHIEIQQ